MRILLTGATGHLGRDLQHRFARDGHVVRILSRRPRPRDHEGEWVTADLGAAPDLDAATRDVEAVVHAASGVQQPARSDVAGTTRLADAARRAGVRHLLHVSIIGVDRIPLAYYRAKLAAEQAVAASGVPFTVLRAAQFHYLVDLLLAGLARTPWLLPVPAGFRVQPVGTGDVADEIAQLLAAGPQRRAPDLAGPEAMRLAEAARRWAAVRAPGKRVVEVPLPGRMAAAFRAGHNTVPDAPRGLETFDAYLRVSGDPDRIPGTGSSAPRDGHYG